jgi:hypothetical protein
MTTALLLAVAMYGMWQVRELVMSPTCAFCGKKREHARDCPERKRGK